MFKLNLIPQDKKFYEIFNKLSANLVKLVVSFETFLKDYKPPRTEHKGTADLMEDSAHLKEIFEIDNYGDKLVDEMFTKLFSTFVTPLDREDIHSLAKLLSSIMEHVTGAARRFDMYHIQAVPPAVIEMVQILLECVREIEVLIGSLDNLSNLKTFTSIIERLHQQEKQGDKIYRKAIKELFYNSSDPVEIIKWKDIYERIENSIDKCNAASSVFMGIILKYA
jgi:predicted phosphate transport protein (TIGR00153 family)